MDNSAQRNCRIRVYKDGKHVGFWTPDGATNRLRVHAALMTRERSQDVIGELEIKPDVVADKYTFQIVEG